MPVEMETAIAAYALSGDWLAKAFAALQTADISILAPVKDEKGRANLKPVNAPEEMATDYINLQIPLKRLFLPPTEVLFTYKNEGDGSVDMTPAPNGAKDQVIFGCRPCDARALVMLDKVFYWDYEDVPYRERRDRSTVVTFACMESGPKCFCTSLGGSPHGTEGSDAVVFLMEDGASQLHVMTEKGKAFADRISGSLQPLQADAPAPPVPEMAREFDVDQIKTWLDHNFESEFWTDVSMRCLGCGVCSYLCPTCHCFDIVDESTWKEGERRRNQDSCSFCLFTKHASGHNPRPNQTERCRQRVMHKFRYFQDRFGMTACVGCGRCITNCGVGQDLVSILSRIQDKSEIEQTGE